MLIHPLFICSITQVHGCGSLMGAFALKIIILRERQKRD